MLYFPRVFLLLLLALPQEEPAAAFRKIEDSLRAARTLSIRYSYDFHEEREGKETVVHGGEGLLLVGEGNRIHTWVDMKMGLFGSSFLLVSDGKQVRLKYAEEKRKDCPPDLREMFIAGLAKEGVFLDTSILMLMDLAGKPGEGLPRLGVTEIREGKADGEARGLVLTVKAGRARTIELWYDPKTQRPLRRRLQTHPGRFIVERYTEWTVDAEIPAETFALDAKRSGPAAPPVPELTGAELSSGYIRAKIGVARELKKGGQDEKAVAALEEVILTFPTHERTKEALQLYREWKKD